MRLVLASEAFALNGVCYSGFPLILDDRMRLIEVAPPRGHETQTVIGELRQLRSRGIDGVHVPDGTSGPRLSALALAVLIRQQAGLEVVLQFSSRDRPLLVADLARR